MLPAVFLVLVGVLTYAGSFTAPFVFDDVHAIVENPFIRHLWPFWHAASAPAQTALSGRPIVSLSFALNYAVGGLSPAGYHAWNLAIHISAALLLFAIVRRHLAEWTAFLVAAIWLVHPIQSEVVTTPGSAVHVMDKSDCAVTCEGAVTRKRTPENSSAPTSG